MDYPVIYSSSMRKPKEGIDFVVNFFEYVEWKTARYNRLIAKFKPYHKVSELLDLKKLRELHRKFDLRETYNSSFYAWHRSSVMDVLRKIAVINIRDHMRLLLLNKEIANSLMGYLNLPIELIILISEFLPNRVVFKVLVLNFKENGKRIGSQYCIRSQKGFPSHAEGLASFGESSLSCR
jgi:hypothetical protein